MSHWLPWKVETAALGSALEKRVEVERPPARSQSLRDAVSSAACSALLHGQGGGGGGVRGSIAECPVLLPGNECWLLWGSSHLLSWLQSYTPLLLLGQEAGPALLPVSSSSAVIPGDAEAHMDCPLRP